MLGCRAVFRGRRIRAVRVSAAAFLLAASVVPAFAGRAAGEESLSDLKAKMSGIQAELDAATARVENLRDRAGHLTERIEEAEARIAAIEKRNRKLQRKAVDRAQELYMSGTSGMAEALFGSDDFSELADRAEMLSQISLGDSSAFVRLARSRAETERLTEQLAEDRAEARANAAKLSEESDALQEKLKAAQAQYELLRDRLAGPAPAVASAPMPSFRGGLACPVAGPHSFSDTWGAPRSGHTHQGVDIMAAYGTPVVAITSGTITLSSYGSSAGYWQILSGDDGNQYWYMHNQRNIVNGGHVATGQQIATVGDTGNAAGTPHLHFEFHPGGGSAVNPYPLVASVC